MHNIIIAGGGFANKGAQAMTLICICELKKRFPDYRILLLTWNASQQERNKYAMYDFELLEVPPLKFSKAALNPIRRMVYTFRYGDQFLKTDRIYRNTDLFVDISGYALSSSWGGHVCEDFLDAIEHAQAYKIPVYLLPQSFGPLDFTGDRGRNIEARVRRLLPKVKKIFAREQEGYDALISRYGLSNVTLTRDMVLTSTIRDYSPALRGKYTYSLPDIPENSMCVIPNVRVGDNGINDIQALYCAAIREGIAQGFTVYITHHSTQDKELCSCLKQIFAGDDRVVLLEHDHTCIEFNELVKKFPFIVASRFHAIVHALKNGVPCIALGWAVKYIDLLNLFDQGAYMLDLRNRINPESVCSAVAAMKQNHSAESQRIKEILPSVQQENIFDSIE